MDGSSPQHVQLGNTGEPAQRNPETNSGRAQPLSRHGKYHSGPSLCPLRGGPGQELALGLSDSLPRLSVTLKMAFEAAQLLPKEPAALSTQDGANACLSLDTIHAPVSTVCVDRGSQGDEHRLQRPRHTAGGCCQCPADTRHHKTGTAGTAEQGPAPRDGLALRTDSVPDAASPHPDSTAADIPQPRDHTSPLLLPAPHRCQL